jgi:hypothetical protein
MNRSKLTSFTTLTVVLAFVGAIMMLSTASAQTQAATEKSTTVTVTGSNKWIDTGMDVAPGDKLHITATGTVNFSDKTGISPAGAPREWKDAVRDYQVSNAGRGALVGQVGTDRAVTPFLVGADGNITVMATGRLYLGINQDSYAQPTGQFDVKIDRTAAAKSTTAATNYNFQPLFKTLDANLPYRVTDQAAAGGNEGDLVNFVLVGSEKQVTEAFKDAGWVLPDKTNQQAVVSAIMATLQKEAYVTMPISTLYLFGRGQDYGYARAEAIKVIGQRDHFRIWQAPFTGPNGETLWAGAGTHDIGIEKDQRRDNAYTHKIDANVDGERDFIAQTITDAGAVQATGYLDRPKQVKETKTATGGEIKSDGRTLVIVLK